ncbi:MAG: hypothetical protein CM15mP32_4400 [Flavobacteriaceae bacterium]|nr:MAG: hypothetical protein CM15mP32_4400 [Flavobacteriaceae bacterium]
MIEKFKLKIQPRGNPLEVEETFLFKLFKLYFTPLYTPSVCDDEFLEAVSEML